MDKAKLISYQAEAWNKISEINKKLNYEKRFHSQEAIMVGNSGATDDYMEIYEFPCCGKRIEVGDGPVSRFRADGCCVAKHIDNNEKVQNSAYIKTEKS